MKQPRPADEIDNRVNYKHKQAQGIAKKIDDF